MFHCLGLSQNPILKSIGARVGWVGVDLFFVLSGYLIGHQIFSTLKYNAEFSLKTFYLRRCFRTLPSYFFVLGLYILVPFFREQPLTTPLYKFLTFTQNFGLNFSAFSHAWSLCIEEQFYFLLPLVALLVAHKTNLRPAWFLVCFILLAGMFFRGAIWIIYIQFARENTFQTYMTQIYYPSYCRLDGLVLGVSIAMFRNFHQNLWTFMMNKGKCLMAIGLLGCYFTVYPLSCLQGFIPTTFGYLLRSLSFAALTLAALSPNTLLYKIKIPGAMTLSVWSYAIYLTHKQIIHMTQSTLSHFAITPPIFILLFIEILFSLMGGWLLYTYIEAPFLKLREYFGKSKRIHQLKQDTFSGSAISPEIFNE